MLESPVWIVFRLSQYDRTNQHLPCFRCRFLSSPLQYTILNSAFISILKRSSVNRFRSEFDRPGKETRLFPYWLAQLANSKEGSSAETRCRVKEGNVLTSAFPPAISSSCQALFLKAKHVPAPPGRRHSPLTRCVFVCSSSMWRKWRVFDVGDLQEPLASWSRVAPWNKRGNLFVGGGGGLSEGWGRGLGCWLSLI